MKRDVDSLAAVPYDVLVVGGGIFGAWTAWDATTRGLRVALVDRADFASGTSANSLKILHGGFRDFARLRFLRARQGLAERSVWMRLAPHLVRPLPVLVPLGRGWRWARWLLAPPLALFDALGSDLDRLTGSGPRIPRSRTVGPDECMEIAPWLEAEDVGAGVVFHDAQIYDTERMVVGLLRSASRRRARIANYVEVTGFAADAGKVAAARAVDRLTGRELTIRASAIVACVGPWLESLLAATDARAAVSDAGDGDSGRDAPSYLKGLNVIVDDRPTDHAVGVASRARSAGAHTGFDRQERYLFVTPWRDRTIIGTRYFIPDSPSGPARPQREEIRALLDELRAACPALDYVLDDVVFTHAGLIPAEETDGGGPGRIVSEARIRGHEGSGLAGLVSVVGPKYTAARRVAAEAVDRLASRMGWDVPKTRTAVEPLFGARGGTVGDWLERLRERCGGGLSDDRLIRLTRSYGAGALEVLESGGYFESSGDDRERGALLAEVRHAVRREMAVKLADVVFRRTGVGTAGNPGRDVLLSCAGAMAEELGWSERRTRDEVGEVVDSYSGFLPMSGECG